MKARILILTMSVIAMATACSIDEVTSVNEDNAISFRSVVPHATRAETTTASTLHEFSVWGYTQSGEALMKYVTAVRETVLYTTNPTYFWPSSPVDFYALSPVVSVSDDEVSLTTPDGSATIGTVSFGASAQTVDISAIPYDSRDQIDLIYAACPGQTAASSPVNLNFRHALSQIVFKAKNTNSDMDVLITGVRVVCVYGANTYTLPSDTSGNLSDDVGSTGAAQGYQGTWGDEPSEKAYFKAGLNLGSAGYIDVKGPEDGETAEVFTLSASDGALFMLPQEVKGWNHYEGDHYNEAMGAYFLIDCKILEHGVEVWPASENVEYAEVAVPVDVDWDEGYRYTYTFVFGNGAGYYPPTATGHRVSGYPVDPEEAIHSEEPEDPKEGVDPTPVISPITFTVEVDEFQTYTDPDSADGSIEESTDTEDHGNDEELEPTDDIIPYMNDETFKSYCLAQYDIDENGKVSSDEVAYVTELTLNDVTDFAGIEYFARLESLTAKSAEKLDLSKNTELNYIMLGVNASSGGAPIETLDLSKNTKLTELPSHAFHSCANLTSITLPQSLVRISSYGFTRCGSLLSIDLPEGLADIRMLAFEFCTSLRSVTFPSTIESVGGAAFMYDSYLTDVYVKAQTPPSIETDTFTSIGHNAGLPEGTVVTLYVPEGCIDAYKETIWWTQGWFDDIQEFSF